MQLEAAQLLRRGGIRRSTEKDGQVLDAANIVALVSALKLQTVMSSIMRRRSGLMVSSFIGVLPSRGEVGHPSILETGRLPRHPNPFSRSRPPPAEPATSRATPPAKRVRS
jgi:hypothetical protein